MSGSMYIVLGQGDQSVTSNAHVLQALLVVGPCTTDPDVHLR